MFVVKYVALLTLIAAMATTSTISSVASSSSPQESVEPLPSPPPVAVNDIIDRSDDGFAWTEVIECYRKPQAAIGCLESRMSRALHSMRDTAVRMARSDPNTAAEDATGVGELVQQIGEFISYGISSYFRGDSGDETDEEPAVAASPTDVDEGELCARP